MLKYTIGVKTITFYMFYNTAYVGLHAHMRCMLYSYKRPNHYSLGSNILYCLALITTLHLWRIQQCVLQWIAQDLFYRYACMHGHEWFRYVFLSKLTHMALCWKLELLTKINKVQDRLIIKWSLF
jgi:hypothetical protein